MAYRKRGSAALQRAFETARNSRYPIDQVINAKDALHPFPVASEARATATRANWAVQLTGQTIPLIWEPLEEESDDTFGAGI